MDDYHHNRYFKDIDYDLVQTSTASASSTSTTSLIESDHKNADAFLLNSFPTYLWAMQPVYEARLVAILQSDRTLHISDLEQLSDLELYTEVCNFFFIPNVCVRILVLFFFFFFWNQNAFIFFPMFKKEKRKEFLCY